MNGYRVPLVPLVTIRATYDCVYFPDGEEDAATWGGWCDPSNPWGTLWGDDEYRADDDSDAYGRNGPPVELTLPVGEAARFLADFPGGVWDLCEGSSSVNYRTGVDVSVTAHADGPGAVAALTLAGELLAGRR